MNSAARTSRPSSSAERPALGAPHATGVPRRRARTTALAALGSVVLVASTALGASTPASGQVPDQVLLTALEETQTVTVPSGVLGAYILVDGGGGNVGYNGVGVPSAAGSGGEVSGTILVEEDQVLTIDVGSQPLKFTPDIGNPAPAWGGDAPGGTSYGSDSTVGGGGGGASSVLIDGEYQMVAGGGGGGGGKGTFGGIDSGGKGGSGGGNGSNGSNGSGPGHGHGGAAGSESTMAGGAGAPEHDDAGPGGGGGGGWKGGAGGSGGGTGGGGGGGGGAGSSYLGPDVLYGAYGTAPQPADGQVVVTWIRSAICPSSAGQAISPGIVTQFKLPCYFQGVPGTEITFGAADYGTPSVVDAADGTIEYTPYDDAWVGTDQFSYTLTNANGEEVSGFLVVSTTETAVKAEASASTASHGDEVQVTASGLKPNEQVKVRLHSEPIELTTAQADENGEVHATVTIPDQAEVGDHQIEVLGEGSGSLLTPIAITKGAEAAPAPDASESSTPWALIGLGVAVVVGLGVAALATSRRRSGADPSATS